MHPDPSVLGFSEKERIMASFAHVQHPSQHYLAVRAELAAQAYQHTLFTLEVIGRFAERVAASVKHAFQRWAAAHRQTVQDRMFWELALADPRVMSEIRAIKAHAELDGTSRG
jgi:hypothetical protein